MSNDEKVKIAKALIEIFEDFIHKSEKLTSNFEKSEKIIRGVEKMEIKKPTLDLIAKIKKKFKLNRYEASVIAVLYLNGNFPFSLTGLMRFGFLSSQKVQESVNSLEKKKIVNVVRRRQGRRGYEVTLTDNFLKKLEKALSD